MISEPSCNKMSLSNNFSNNTATGMESISIEIPSLIENIRIVESFIDNAKDRFQFNDDLYGNIMITVTESVSNAIRHGNKENKEKNVKLSLHLSDEYISFTVSDEGAGFDYNNLPDPTAPENLEKLGGRGIFIMQHLCDSLNFSNNGRTVELVFKI